VITVLTGFVVVTAIGGRDDPPKNRAANVTELVRQPIRAPIVGDAKLDQQLHRVVEMRLGPDEAFEVFDRKPEGDYRDAGRRIFFTGGRMGDDPAYPDYPCSGLDKDLVAAYIWYRESDRFPPVPFFGIAWHKDGRIWLFAGMSFDG
jgi:hypothetical protein